MTKRKTPAYWNDATRHLSQHDTVLKGIIGQYLGETLAARGDAFYTLTRSVISQQISVKAADAIWSRVEAAAGGMHPASLRKMGEEELRACGLSRQKINYLYSLADFFLARRHAERDWESMSDEEVIEDLTQIKGIGRWTAEMFLIFHLLRPDVLPVADLGLQKAVKLHYGEAANKERLHEVAIPWQPYRSVATWYLWRSLDPVAVEY